MSDVNDYTGHAGKTQRVDLKQVLLLLEGKPSKKAM